MLRTPLYEEHHKLGARMVEFGGWEMPVQYRGILPEHEHTRKKAALFDICHMGEFRISGTGAGAFLDRMLTSLPSALEPGQCRYGLMLNAEGGVIDDTIVYGLGPEKFMLVVNAGTRDKDFAHLNSALPEGVQLENISDQTAKLDLQGPESFDVLDDIFGSDLGLRELRYFRFAEKGPGLMSRTGYTGELGVEIYFAVEQCVSLWQTLLKHPAVEAAGLGARDTIRLECGLPLYGHELDEEHSALSSGVERFIRWESDFVGRAALEKQKADGVCEKMIGLKGESRSSPRAGEALFSDGQKVGTITSGSLGPSLGVAVAMARVRSDADGPDFYVEKGKRQLAMRKTEWPFYRQGTARKKLN